MSTATPSASACQAPRALGDAHRTLARGPHHRMTTAAALLLVLAAPSRPAAAEVFAYEDANGVVHFTNVDPNAPKPVDDSDNTYTHKDAQGDVRRLHRVDVAGFDALIRDAAHYYSLPAALVKAVVAAESAFEPQAVSKAGALGLMQLMPQTARRMHVAEPFDPRANLFGGARYLRLMANRFGGSIRQTLAAYNAGPDAVERYGGIPPYRETRRYIERVLTYYRYYVQHDAL